MPTEEKSGNLDRMAKVVASLTALVIAFTGLAAAVRQFVPALQTQGSAAITSSASASPVSIAPASAETPSASPRVADQRVNAVRAAPPEPSDYIVPTSATMPLAPEMLQGLSAAQLRLARNEIYARHGWRFRTPQLDAYFRARNWYHPAADNQSIQLNAIEKANIQRITEAEKTTP